MRKAVIAAKKLAQVHAVVRGCKNRQEAEPYKKVWIEALDEFRKITVHFTAEQNRMLTRQLNLLEEDWLYLLDLALTLRGT